MAFKKNSAQDSTIRVRTKPESKTRFPIVGIGASAGGLEALEKFFKNMPAKSGMAFVVIQHLDPNHIGIMPELIQRTTQMKVLQASEKLKVKPNNVYVIPPAKSLTILNGKLYLFTPTEPRGFRLPIDIFFRSLAVDQQDFSVGIILSGMGSDGALGVKAIKENNGIVLVQDPASSKFDGMPLSSSSAVIADFIAPVEELPAKLIDILKYVPLNRPEPTIEAKNYSSLDKIIILLREQEGHDFSFYKKNTLFRRIERRKGIHQIDRISNYVRFLQENPKEVETLFKELLIGVTNFFRDAELWENIKTTILPELIKEAPSGTILRSWVTGCSTGEEAYSLAIIFKEAMHLVKHSKKISLQIFATDLDNDAIEIARKGIFTENITNDVSPERITKFFTPVPGGYQVNPFIREMVVFASQNLIKDPPFTKIDILTCRNVMIYMESELQKKLIALFHYSLNPDGYLILGSAESIGDEKNAFNEVDSKLKIYKRSILSTSIDLVDFPSSFYKTKKTESEIKRQYKRADSIQSTAEQILLDRFAPSSVLTNKNGDILYITGSIGKFIEPVAGKANWNINVMAREGLKEIIPSLFRNTLRSFEPITAQNVRIGINGGTQLVNITMQCIESPEILKGMVIIVFSELNTFIERKISETDSKSDKKRASQRERELEADLQDSFENIQSLREEMQTSQEELKTTNEELQSTNEELQSTNEELTTSKEEMQSLNEELQTVNTELQSKVQDSLRTSDDMKNLLNSTEIATLFIDKDLNVKRFTDQITTIFKFRIADIGRPFTDLVTDLRYPEIKDHAIQVLKTLSSIETAISTMDNRWYSVRIMPYRTNDDRIDGLVMTFSDITIAKNLELELKEANDALRNINKS